MRNIFQALSCNSVCCWFRIVQGLLGVKPLGLRKAVSPLVRQSQRTCAVPSLQDEIAVVVRMAKGLELLERAGREPQKVILVRSDIADVARQGQERRLGVI